jgi:hypothetical protein
VAQGYLAAFLDAGQLVAVTGQLKDADEEVAMN